MGGRLVFLGCKKLKANNTQGTNCLLLRVNRKANILPLCGKR